MTRGGARFSRVEPRRRARAFVLGLLAELPRKNCWTIAEHAGDRTPDRMQHLLSRARWDADGSGLRWTIEENFHAGKGLTGLDEHQVRRWTSWYRWSPWPCSAPLSSLSPPPSNPPAARPRPGRSR